MIFNTSSSGIKHIPKHRTHLLFPNFFLCWYIYHCKWHFYSRFYPQEWASRKITRFPDPSSPHGVFNAPKNILAQRTSGAQNHRTHHRQLITYSIYIAPLRSVDSHTSLLQCIFNLNFNSPRNLVRNAHVVPGDVLPFLNAVLRRRLGLDWLLMVWRCVEMICSLLAAQEAKRVASAHNINCICIYIWSRTHAEQLPTDV